MRAIQAGALALLTLGASGSSLWAQAPKASPAAEPVRIGGSIKAPANVKKVAPVYPAKARESRVQGIVILDLTIGTDGTVTDVKVLRPIHELNDAAIEAAKQWRYEPTKIDGVAVPVRMTVSLNFTLH
jgi:periplasmic protein TonB